MNAVTIFLAIVIILTIIFVVYFLMDLVKNKEAIKNKEHWVNLSLAGLVTQFFDTLGIGSYGTLTAWFKISKAVPDKLIPGTLNTCTIITMTIMTLAYVTSIEVEIPTLIVPVVCSAIGAFFSAGIISKLPEKQIRLGMGIALIIVAVVIALGVLGFMPGGGEAIGLSTGKLVILGIVSLVLGALMCIGIGAYAPMMATVYLLGLSPLVAFPIMMGACAVLIPIAGIRFVRESRKSNSPKYDYKSVICISIFGTIGVLIAVFIVKSMPLTVLKWLVICVLTYTSIMLLRDAFKKNARTEEEPAVTAAAK